MGQQLPIGVIGLGRRWQNIYWPTLKRLGDKFHIGAVGDALPDRAHQEARRLGCAAAAGPTDLLDRPDLAALLLLDCQWYRLWPLQVACRKQKPVFCVPPLESDDDHADRMVQQISCHSPNFPVMMAFPFRFAPITAFLKQLTETELGPVRFVSTLAGWRQRQPTWPLGTSWLDWCSGFFSQEPVRASVTAGLDQEWLCTFLDFGQGRGVQATQFMGGRSQGRQVTLICARGTANVDFPGTVHWHNAAGQHSFTLPRPKPLAQLMLENFYRCLVHDIPPEPTLLEAHRLLHWLRAARQSWQEQRPIEVGQKQEPSVLPA